MRSIHKPILVFIFFFCFGFILQAQSDYLKIADTAYKLNHYKDAIQNYQKHLGESTNDQKAMLRLAESYNCINTLESAAFWYKKAASISGLPSESILSYAQILKSLEKYNEAKNWFLAYAEHSPNIGNHYAASCDYAMANQKLKPIYSINIENINTTASEFSPSLWGNKLVYATSRGDLTPRGANAIKNWTGQNQNYLVMAQRDIVGRLTKPVAFHSEIKENMNEGPLSFSEDGKWVAFAKNNFIEGVRQNSNKNIKMDLYIAKVSTNGEWLEAKAFPFNNGAFSTGYPHLSDNGNTLHFSSDRPDGFGGFDIYVSYRKGDTWTTPKNLGKPLNTAGNEISPFLQQKTLYFSSDFHKGFGGLDIFKAVQQNSKWNTILHLGTDINSGYDEYSFIVNESSGVGYFVSNRKSGKGLEDIYSFTKTTLDFTINVLDAANQKPIKDAVLDFRDCGENAYMTDDKGMYQFHALNGLDCNVKVKKVGYIGKTMRIKKNSNGVQNVKVLLNKKQVAESYTEQIPKVKPKEKDKSQSSSAVSAKAYSGKIVDAYSGNPISDALVRVTNKNTKERQDSFTDNDGNYTVFLSPTSKYVIKYSKALYTETSVIVETKDGLDPNLGIHQFLPSGTQVALPPKKKEENPTAYDTTTKPSLEDKAEIQKETNAPPILSSGYAVQLISVKPSNRKIPFFGGIVDLGEIYTYSDETWKRYRVGIFATKKEAEEMKIIIDKQGYERSFIVKETTETLSKREIVRGVNLKGLAREFEPDQAYYKVQIATYKNLENFDESNLQGLGIVEKQERSDGLTVIFLGNYMSLDKAKSVSEKAMTLGYNGAFPVQKRNGKFTRIKS